MVAHVTKSAGRRPETPPAKRPDDPHAVVSFLARFIQAGPDVAVADADDA